MPSPFPGMDPYLEDSVIFPNFHHQLISHMQGVLNRVLRPKYVACSEDRVYISSEDDPGRKFIVPDVEIRETPSAGQSHVPMKATVSATAILDVAEPILVTTLLDDEIHEPFIEIQDVRSKAIVTVIEILSPTNKCVGAAGRNKYLQKRRDLYNSETHFVEIDFLRDGKPTFDRDVLPPHNYAVHVSQLELRPKGKFWPILLRQRLPIIDIPLRNNDPDAKLDLQAVFEQAYEFGAYDLVLDYGRPPKPPLPADLHDWATTRIAAQGGAS